jgi:hypothetical protein
MHACRADVKSFTMGGVVPEHCGLSATAASLRTMSVLLETNQVYRCRESTCLVGGLA